VAKSKPKNAIDSSALAPTIDTVDLNLFHAYQLMFTYKSVSLAAEHLGVNQSQASKLLIKLRNIFNDELLVYSKQLNQLVPTAKGKQLAMFASKGIEELKKAFLEENEIAEEFYYLEPHVFKMIVEHYAFQLLIPAYLEDIRDIAPKIKYEISDIKKHYLSNDISSEQLENLEYGAIDALITSTIINKSFVEREVLLTDEWVFVAHHDYPLDVKIQHRYLGGLDLILTANSPLLKIVESKNDKKEKQVELNVIVEVPTFSDVAACIAKTRNAVSFMPKRLANYFVEESTLYQGSYSLKILEHTMELPNLELYIYTSKSNQSNPSVTWLKKTFKDLCTRGY